MKTAESPFRMRYKRRVLQCGFVLAVAVILPVALFRPEDAFFASTATDTRSSAASNSNSSRHVHGTSEQQTSLPEWSPGGQGATATTTIATPVQSPQVDLPPKAVIINNYTATAAASSSSQSIPTARLNECLVKANRMHIHDVFQEHRSQGLPLFSAIVQSPARLDEQSGVDSEQEQEQRDDLYWTAHFTLVHLTWRRPHAAPRVRYPQWSYPDQGAIWYCDGREAVLVNQGCPQGNSLNVRCPQKNDEMVTNITIYNYTYYVQDHVDCELHHAIKKPQPTAQVAAAVMVYKMNLQLALEWIEYHRLVGIDHFFLYILDTDWEGWPDLDYITYIPWNLNPQLGRSMVDLFLFQTAAQISAILRARALGLTWVAMNDLDEYLVTRGPYAATSAIVSPTELSAARPRPLQTLLANFEDKNSNVAAIQGQTVSFGRKDASNRTRLPFLLKYKWRNDITYGMKRTKCIVRPTHTEYYVIHWVSWPEPKDKKLVIHKADPKQELWIHHYKSPQNGPFTKDLRQSKTVEDPFLHDMYASIVSERVVDILARIQQNSIIG